MGMSEGGECQADMTFCKLKLSCLFRRNRSHKLSWKGTYRAMAAANEDWSDLDVAVSDGLNPRE